MWQQDFIQLLHSKNTKINFKNTKILKDCKTESSEQCKVILNKGALVVRWILN